MSAISVMGWIPPAVSRYGPEAARGGNAYKPLDEFELQTAIQRLEIDPQQYTFIDLGCSKGKALIVASNWKFAQLIGVELITELARIGGENLRSFQFPSTNVVIFMKNPFDGGLLEHVMKNFNIAIAKKIIIIYYVLGHAAVLENYHFLIKRSEYQGARTNHLFQIWSNVTEIPPGHAILNFRCLDLTFGVARKVGDLLSPIQIRARYRESGRLAVRTRDSEKLTQLLL